MNTRFLKILVGIFLLSVLICFTSCEDVSGLISGHTHTFSSWSNDTATCTEEGTQERICSSCKYKETRKTAALGHRIVQYGEKAPSCTEDGNRAYEKCLGCDYTTLVSIPKISHSLIQIEAKAPSCTEVGNEAYEKCENCDYTTYKELPVTDHSYGEWYTEGDYLCTDKVTEYRECEVCEAKESKVTQGFSHTFGEWQGNTATCTENGTEYRLCEKCDFKETRDTYATYHTLSAWYGSTSTCTKRGTEKRDCEICDYSETRSAALKDHEYGEWMNNTATCYKDGTETRACKNCSHTDTRVANAKGHTFVDGVCSECGRDGILVLIENGKANFGVVYTTSSGVPGKRAADSFVAYLREKGVEIADAVSDRDTSAIKNCEIIIGANALNRGTDCSVSDKYLGKDGRTVKFVGDRIIIAGGTEASTLALFDEFTKTKLEITDSLNAIFYLEADRDFAFETLTDYQIDSIKIGSLDLSEYVLITDIGAVSGYDSSDILGFRDSLYDLSGYWLEKGTITSKDFYSHSFIIRSVSDAGSDGFRVYVSGDDFIVECSYANAFNKAFAKFFYENFTVRSGNVTFGESYEYKSNVSVVYYEDFDAVGDGKTCDFNAIYNTHIYANQCGQKVLGKADATYYISAGNFTKTIPVKTNVDFLGATFIVDDTGSNAYKYRELALFTLERDYSAVSLNAAQLVTLAGATPTLDYDATEIPWLVGTLKAKSLVRLINSHHKDFIRHGANQTSGANRMDTFVVDVDGSIAPDTPVAYNFDNVTKVEIYRVDDTPITIENGTFHNICCRAVPDTYHDANNNKKKDDGETIYANKYHSYKRGFKIHRSNVTIEGIVHEMLKEPDIGSYNPSSGYVKDSLHDEFGSRHESYPYYGFLYIVQTYNLNVVDSVLTGHTTYYEDKPATASTGWKVPEPVAMGSYDFVIEYSSNVTFKGVTQPVKTGLGDKRYWGIMSSNGSKNLTFIECEINRFDAHAGFWNATLIDTTIGHSLNVIGGGLLRLSGVIKLTGSNFISLRGDYGSTFKGDMIIENCVYKAYREYNTNQGGKQTTSSYITARVINAGSRGTNVSWNASDPSGAYWLWDFGYTCYMPINVTIDNFKTNATRIFVYNNLPDVIFTYSYDPNNITENSVRYPYQLTKSITFKNMSSDIPICDGSKDKYTKLYSIKINH